MARTHELGGGSVNRGTLALSCGALLLAATAVAAQEALDEIIVTATKREQTLQEIPVAVTVTTAQTLEQAQILDLLDLQSVVPSLRVTQLQTSTQTNFVIRGFGNGANNPGIESSVGVFVDGVYRSRSAAQIGDLIDVERVEVLRGPQSTLFGQNASAGVISIITRLPDREFNATLDATLGSYDERLLRGRVSGPMGKSSAYSLAGSINKRDGYFENLAGGPKINDRDRWDVRGQLLFDPGDNVSVRLIADTSKIDELCCGVVNLLNGPTGALVQAVGGKLYTGNPFARAAYLDRSPVNTVDNDGVSVQTDWGGGKLRFKSITAVRHQKADFDYDADFTSARLVPTNLNQQDIDTVTEEFRVTHEGAGRVTWMIGGYYVHEDVAYDNRIAYGADMRPYVTGLIAAQTGDPTVLSTLEGALGLPGGTFFASGQSSAIASDQKMDSFTMFGQTDIDLSKRTTLTLGLAHTHNQKDVQLTETNTDVFGGLNLVTVGFGGAFGALTGGLPPTPQNLGANPVAAATADFISVTPCSPSHPPPACNSLLGLYPLQFLTPVVPLSSASDDSKTTYTVRIAFDLADHATVYGGVSSGFKATSWNLSRDSKPVAPGTPDRSPLGGYVNPYYGRYGSRYAGPEDSTVLEVGFKGQWPHATLNAALFSQEIKGFQSNIFTGTGFTLGNAGKQSTQGVEIETVLKPNDLWDVTLAGTFMDPWYDSYVGAAGPNGPTDLSGTRPAGVHRTSITMGFAHHWMAGGHQAFVRADYLYESNVQVVENVPSQYASRGVGTVDASAGMTFGEWQASIWARNLNNDNYLLSAFPSVAQQGSLSGYTNPPRTWGLSLRRDF
jgi:iron complex outermembrane receptor protein